jgi:hypothetical protein
MRRPDGYRVSQMAFIYYVMRIKKNQPTFVSLKKLFNISLSFTLIAALLLGYTGVPVYKMVCGSEGKTVVSFTDLKGACHHQEKKSCCKPEKDKGDCCDYFSEFFQLHELTLIKACQNTAGHLPVSSTFHFGPVTFSLAVATTPVSCNESPPWCKVKPRPSFQSLLQTFLI